MKNKLPGLSRKKPLGRGLAWGTLRTVAPTKRIRTNFMLGQNNR